MADVNCDLVSPAQPEPVDGLAQMSVDFVREPQLPSMGQFGALPTLLPGGRKGTIRFDLSPHEDRGDEKDYSPAVKREGTGGSALHEKSNSRFTGRTGVSSNWDVEDPVEGLETSPWCWDWSFCCTGSGVCYCAYVLIFSSFLVFFPLFLKWMITASQPQGFWYQEFEQRGSRFPQLADWKFVRQERGRSYKLDMSGIPRTWSGCNHSCSTRGGFLSPSSEMNFNVKMKLEADNYTHTAYPLLLASNDFSKWWVAADRRHAHPQKYFASHTAEVGSIYSHVTDSCTRPPEILPGLASARSERYSASPMYVLVCVTWNKKKAAGLRLNRELAGKDMGQFCDAVGGVCGWPCRSNPQAPTLPGCNVDGTLRVDAKSGHVAGVPIFGTRFSGYVSARACLRSPGSKDCITSTLPMSKWQCHRCQNETSNFTLAYDSLPPMELELKSAPVDTSVPGTVDPQAFVFTSSLDLDGDGPAGMKSGMWQKLYDHNIFPGPSRTDEIAAEVDEITASPTRFLDSDQNAMRYSEKNKVNMEPSWCFGRRGPLYLVACALNMSTYDAEFEFKPGQEVAGPPFNDRCLTVTGRCGHACTEREAPMQYCDANGYIDQNELFDYSEDRKNNTVAVYAFLITLLIGFSVKILAYVPGLFIPYGRAKYYSPEMTEQLKYIAVCSPSGGETKACVLRNLVGAMSSLPTDCECPFHVIFADEGHRHPQKIMFRVFVSVMNYVPDVRMTEYNAKKKKTGYKQDNLKAFTHAWVETTKKMLLEDCSTEKLVQKIALLEADSRTDNPEAIDTDKLQENAAAMEKLQAKIDALCGKAALRIMQDRKGWPRPEVSSEIRDLERSILQLQKELTVGEKKFDGSGTSYGQERDKPKSVNYDDCEAYCWVDMNKENPYEHPLYNLHYIARAKPEEDERTLAVQHVARGIWCYKVPKHEESRERRGWLKWRQKLEEFQLGEELNNHHHFLVPIRTSRGKAGGLNFAENYLFDFHRTKLEKAGGNPEELNVKHGLFSIADARHQYQPDFFLETIPYFFRNKFELNPRVAFTQVPQYFQEMPDDADFLDTNNSSFFRLGCMLRNCCGGVSSCGTNGTWLVRDRRAGVNGDASMWELKGREMEQGFSQVVERRFFHESCKVEDTASSLDRVVKGKYSHYINLRLSYGMAKEPTDYLAAVQRWAEGGVVLSLQTFFGSEQGVLMIWMAFMLFLMFMVSIFFMIFSFGTAAVVEQILGGLAGSTPTDYLKEKCFLLAEWSVVRLDQPAQALKDYQEMFYQTFVWVIFLVICLVVLWCITTMSYWIHHCTCFGRRRPMHRTRFPTSLAQWARLLITVDNLTYFLWFWTVFFWVGFNYYSAWSYKDYFFDPLGMTVFMWILQILSWTMMLSATSRYVQTECKGANEVFSLSLTNIWRTTQMFYITAPLTLYSIIMGFSDFLRHRMFGQDISFWVGGDRGALSKQMVKYWTLFLVVGMFFTWFAYNSGWLPDERNALASVIIVTTIGFDVLHPCAFLWLGTALEKLPTPGEVMAQGLNGQMQRCCKRLCQLLFSGAFYRNAARSMLFNSRCTGLMKWIGPLQHVLLPILTLFLPELGINQVLLLVTAVK